MLITQQLDKAQLGLLSVNLEGWLAAGLEIVRYFETLRNVAASNRSSTVFLPSGPRDLGMWLTAGFSSKELVGWMGVGKACYFRGPRGASEG